jgi:hypothetical protein
MKCFFIAILGLASPLLADSVTTTDNLTVFGHVDQLDGTMVRLTGRFRTAKGVETRPWKCPRTQVTKIEFNATTFNPGGPVVAGANPSTAQKVIPAPSASPDVATLRGGENRKCSGAEIAADKVVCGKDTLERTRVIRIVFGH